MILRAPAAMKCAFGENPKGCYGHDKRQSPMTRMAVAALLRELTKRYETVERGMLSTLAERFAAEAPRGECVIAVLADRRDPCPQADAGALDAALSALLQAGLSVRDAAAEAATSAGVSKKTAYARALEIRGETP